MAARTIQQVALEDMRRPGAPTPYSSSYAPNQVRPLGRRAGGGTSIQYLSATLVMGRYADSRAFTTTNPDFGAELSWLGGQIPNFQSKTWNRILPWNHVWLTDEYGLAGRAANTRIVFFGWEVWLRSVATGQWNRITNTDSWTGVPCVPNFSSEDWSMTWRDFRTESNGHQSVRVMLDPNSPTAGAGAGYWAWHGWAGGVQTFTASDLADVFVVARVTKVLHDPNAADDRDAARYACAIGADYYPEPRDVFYPSVGISRHRDIRAKWPEWELIVMHTMTESQLANGGIPPSLASLAENYDPGGIVTPPPVPVVPAGPAPTKGRWVSIYNPSSPKGRWASIAAASGNVAPAWGADPVLTATLGAAFSFTPTPATGSPTPTYTKQSGPAWATVNGTTGAITGTPTGSIGTATVVVRATNVAGTADLTVLITIVSAAVAPTVTTTTLANAEQGVAYNAPLEATGTGPFAWSVVSGTLPAGLTLSATGGVIAGTATTLGLSSFSVRATGPTGLTDDQALTITVSASGSAPDITTTTLADATQGSAYSQTLAGTGATPRTWAIVAGALPPGLSLNTSTGAITGTPTATGGFPFTARLFNALGASELQLSIRVLAAGATTATSPWTALLKGR